MIQRLEADGIPYDTMKLGMISKKLTDPTYLKWTLDALVHLPGALLKYWWVQRKVQPDVVVCTSFRKAAILKPLLDEKRLVMHIHEKPGDTFWTRQVIDGSEGPAAYMACSEFIRDQLVERGVNPERVVAVPNGVEEVPDAQLPDGSADEQPPTIGIVGQIGEWKGHDDLIEALRLLVEEGVPVRCAVIGTGDDEYVQSLKQRVRASGLEDVVEFRGFVHDTDAIYADLDVCVVPSRFEEPFGLVAAEAGMRGIPVVATRRGGLEGIIQEGETGFLVKAEAPGALAERIQVLLEDPVLRAEFGRKARERIQRKYTKSRMVRNVESILERVTSSH
jgi:glycosyltransferase involved in cell wall biosynthesis